MTRPLPLDFPIHNTERILALDVLRGFALFGILYAHMIFWYAGGPLPQEIYQQNKGVGSGIAIGIYMIFVMSKFFSIFSFLFGLSFYIQIQSLAKRLQPVSLRFGWRLTILGVIGFLHHLFWQADILTIYVPLGFLLLATRNLANKTLLILGGLLVLNIPTKLAELISIITRQQVELIHYDAVTAGNEYLNIIQQGDFFQMITHNFHAMKDKYIYQVNTGRFLITFGFFLLGMLAGRLQWFEKLEEHRLFFKKILKRSGAALLCTLVVGAAVGVAIQVLQIKLEKAPLVTWMGGFIMEFLNTSLTFCYISGISLLMMSARWQTRLASLASIGKMALTTYLLQSLLGVFIFFHIGAGMFLSTTPAQNAILCLGIFSIQIILCKIWLRHFHYGPIEWLWRSATDLKWQPFFKRPAALLKDS